MGKGLYVPPPLQKIIGENLFEKSDFYKFLGWKIIDQTWTPDQTYSALSKTLFLPNSVLASTPVEDEVSSNMNFSIPPTQPKK